MFYDFLTSASFHSREIGQAELSDIVFRASESRIQSSAELLLHCGMVCLDTMQNKWTLILQNWKCHQTELQTDAWLKSDSTTSKLFERHISAEQCFSSLFSLLYVSTLIKVFQTIEWKEQVRSPGMHVRHIWLLVTTLYETIGKVWVMWAPCSRKKTKKKPN